MNIEALFDRAGAPARQAVPDVIRWGVISAACTTLVAGAMDMFGLLPPAMPDSAFDLTARGLPNAFLRGAILAPVSETLILGALYALLTTAFASRGAAVVAGLGMAAIHALKGWPAAVCLLIPALILAAPFASPRLSWRGALLRSAGIHAVHNACVILLAAIVIQLTGGNGWTLAPGP